MTPRPWIFGLGHGSAIGPDPSLLLGALAWHRAPIAFQNQSGIKPEFANPIRLISP